MASVHENQPGTSPILLIDDSPTQLALFKEVLESEGFLVHTAQDGMEAISHIYHSPPALVLSDVLMPELNGYHLCRLIKDDPRTSHIPVILLTNLKEPHDRFWGEKAGADIYLEKGTDFSPIIEAVRSLLSHSNALPNTELTPIRSADSDIRARVTDILDRLLYESTVSNEILKFTALATNVDKLATEILRFLAVIIRYDLAGLLLQEGHDKYLLALQATGTVPKSFLENAKNTILKKANLSPEKIKLRLIHLNEGEDHLTDAHESLHLLKSIPIVDGGQILASVTLFDAHRHKLPDRTQRALDVVRDRLLIVAKYLKKAKEIEEVKADFVSMLVHDMRTPLTSIKGFTEILSEGILGHVSEEQAGALENIRSSSDRLLNLIEDILNLSKLEAGKMQIHPSPCHIPGLIRHVVKDLSSLFKDKDMGVSMSIPEDIPYVSADGKQVVRVLINLLNNAVKFSPNGGRITIEATPLPPSMEDLNGSLKIAIMDNGPGIPPEQQKRLFERYEQIHPSSMFRKGTGLGLAICKELVTLHGGKIWVESPLDDAGGSRFCFTLPLA